MQAPSARAIFINFCIVFYFILFTVPSFSPVLFCLFMYIQYQYKYTIFMSILEGPKIWNTLSRCTVPDGRACAPWEGGPS